MESRPLSIPVHVLLIWIDISTSAPDISMWLDLTLREDYVKLPGQNYKSMLGYLGQDECSIRSHYIVKGVFFLYYVCSIICEINHNSVYYCMPSCACCANCISSSLQKHTERWNWDICCCWRLFLFEFENKLNQPVWIGRPWLALAGPGLAGCSSRTSSPAISD